MKNPVIALLLILTPVAAGCAVQKPDAPDASADSVAVQVDSTARLAPISRDSLAVIKSDPDRN